jgi:hypothetical protein
MDVFGWLKLRAESRRVGDAWREERAFPLVILPSTHRAFDLVARLAKSMPIALIGDRALIAQWAPALADRTRTPLALWKEVKSQSRLPFAVISFEDQLVGTDASFLKVQANQTSYSLSIIEIMVLMRFQCPAFVGSLLARPGLASRPGAIELCRYARRLDASLPEAVFEEVLRELMLPMIESFKGAGKEWLASRRFALKLGGYAEKSLATRIQELEALLRLRQSDASPSDRVEPLLKDLRAARKELQVALH